MRIREVLKQKTYYRESDVPEYWGMQVLTIQALDGNYVVCGKTAKKFPPSTLGTWGCVEISLPSDRVYDALKHLYQKGYLMGVVKCIFKHEYHYNTLSYFGKKSWYETFNFPL